LYSILEQRKPFITLIGSTSYGWEIAPSLAVELNIPLVSGCLDVSIDGERVTASKQFYGGKIIGDVVPEQSWGYMLTFPAGVLPPGEGGLNAEVESIDFPLADEVKNKKFIQFVEAVAGEVDIAQAQKIVTVGRGIKEQENLKLVEEFADNIDAVVACSRPIVDAGWLPKDRQVGSSGKTVKPKLYIALGVSGDFQHVLGMRGADTIIAVNKDPNAPIFTVADYGIVDDLFKVVPALQEKILEMKG
jgi:electron transfer flavoprotein alpha subunit